MDVFVMLFDGSRYSSPSVCLLIINKRKVFFNYNGFNYYLKLSIAKKDSGLNTTLTCGCHHKNGCSLKVQQHVAYA